MIKIEHLKKYYDKNLALQIENLTISEGAVLGLVGTNGSGKSTLLRCISGVLTPEEGEITIDGVSVQKNPACKKELLYISDDPIDHVNTDLNALFLFYSTFYGLQREAFEKGLDFFSLPHKGNLSKFSKGMRRRAYLAVALAVKPKILLLDEAFDGLDAQGKQDFIKALHSLLEREEITVILASHSLRELEDLCDGYLLLKEGKVLSYCPEGVSEEKFTKATVAFPQPFDFTALKDERAFVASRHEKIGTLYFAGSEEELEEYLSPYSPAVIECFPMSAEEYFLFKTEKTKEATDE